MTVHATPPVSLRDWQGMVREIYREKDGKDYTLADLLLHLVGRSGRVAKALRRESRGEVLEALPRMFVWLLSFSAMFPLELEEVVWEKYQGLCPYCGVEKDCLCLYDEQRRSTPETWHRNPHGTPPASLDEWQALFDRLYGGVNRVQLLIAVGFHLQEEVGEASDAFVVSGSPEGLRALRHEIADVFAWIMAVCNKMGVKLGEITYSKYPGVCDVCKEPECTCPKV